MAKLTVIVGDTTIWQGPMNSLRVEGDTASFRTNADTVIEIDAEPQTGDPTAENSR